MYILDDQFCSVQITKNNGCDATASTEKRKPSNTTHKK